MDTGSCHCEHSCYLTEVGRQSWTRPDKHTFRMKLHNGVVSMDTSIQPGVRTHAWRHWLPWLWANRSVLVVMVMLLLTVTMPLVWHWRMSQSDDEEVLSVEDGEDYSSDAKLTRILRSLHSLNGNSQQHMVTRNNITSKFPWIRQNNTLPNYFLGGGTRSSDLYKSSPAIFLHQHRSAGEPLVRCLRDIAIAEEGHLSHVPNWDSDTREFWDVKLRSKSEYQRLNLQTGQFAAGLCDIYKDRQCSYFSVFREPMSRAVSSYHHCQTDEGRRLDEMCRVVDANDVTLRDWILVQGSVTFQQLVFHAPWCQQFKQTNNYSLEGSAVHVTPSSEWPCWFKNRIYLERLPATEYSHLLEYVLDHMESLFGAIGILDDWESTIGIFETVYKLPFRKCSNLMQLPADVYNDHDNRANRKPQKDGYYDDNDPDYLKYDYFVRKVLDADFKIYKKARQIFDIQRQTAFNKLKR